MDQYGFEQVNNSLQKICQTEIMSDFVVIMSDNMFFGTVNMSLHADNLAWITLPFLRG